MPVTEPQPETTVEAWNWGYFPFSLGGPPHRRVKATLPAEGPFDLGGGYQGYLITSPQGKTRVAEATTGAIVGDTLEQVRDDIAQGDPEIIAQQVAKAADDGEQASNISAEQFWTRLK